MYGEASVRWTQMYNNTPLREVPAHFQGLCAAPFLLHYLEAVLRLCPPGSRTLETGVGTGYGAIWLSQRGVVAEGIDYAPRIVERAKQTNNLLGGRASFRCGDLFTLYAEMQARFAAALSACPAPYRVIHHQGVLEHFTIPQIQAALAQQVAIAEYVIFSVPSVHYPFDPEFGDERMLPIEEWQRILAPFALEELRYYGDPRFGGREHILAVLRGQPTEDALHARMTVPAEPYPQGITVIVHTRNEAAHIAACLASVQGCADEIIVCDMESTDETLAIVRRVAPQAIIIPHPHLDNFDRARNVSAMCAGYRWILYLDADERIPEGMGPFLRHLLTTQNPSFSALQLPFKHHFAGRWLRCLSPGYKAPSIFKNGCFTYHARTHAGAQVEGPVARLPFDNPDHALPHYAFADIGQYLQKLDRYTVAEAASMHSDGHPFHWREAVRHTVHDLCSYYDAAGAGALDGVHGLLYSVLSGFYRWVQHARLYESRYHAGQLQPSEQEVPGSVEEMLQFALDIAREETQQRQSAQQAARKEAAGSPLDTAEESDSAAVGEGAQSDSVAAPAPVVADVVWCGAFGSASGYGEEGRHFLFGSEEAGTRVAARSNGWREDAEALTPPEAARLRALTERAIAPDAVWIVQDFAPRFSRPEGAGLVIGRTMFETDRIPPDWASACNRMDVVWVPSEFHRQTFLRSGVEAHRLAVIPGCFDPTPFLDGVTQPDTALLQEGEKRPFTFLSVFDWTLHKGWDVLLTGFLQAFEGRDDVALTLKVWSSLGYSQEQIREQAADHVRRTLGHDLLTDPRIRFVFDRLTQPELIALYRAADAFVLPSRGEGWGRPLMEAMACGLPTIGTNWSGNTAFMTQGNSLLLDCTMVNVPEAGWREVPAYKGHRWAEPSLPSLVTHLRRVVEQPDEAREIGSQAQEHVVTHFSRAVVGQQIAAEIDRLRAASSSPRVSIALSLRWEGPFLSRHSLALVNRQICRGLLAEGSVELSLVPVDRPEMGLEEEPGLAALVERSFAPLEGKAAVDVRHQFPPRFDRPEEGQLVLIQPWEYGFLPKEWIAPILANVAEVWCYSRYVYDVYLASGIPEEKLQIVPLGVDTSVFCPDAPPYVFTTEPGAERRRWNAGRPFTFLFVGGTLHRKGIDILLDAYLRAFSACDDDVCLVIKDTGTQTVYRNQNERERILALTQDPNRPAIVYIEEELSPHRLAGLYTACDCLIQPYRGEGFCLPALEAMACGCPMVVLEGGPTNDFVDATVGWRLPAERRPMPENRIGPWECVQTPWMWEVSADDLAQHLRQLRHDPEEVKRRGALAAERVRASWSWQHTTEAVLARLDALSHTDPVLEAAMQEPSHSAVPVPLLPGRRPRISLCMIVRDEERVIGPCLASAKPWVDEIIVVDTGSTDGTVEIALSHGARVEHFVWCDDFSAARNESLRYATGDWILWLDADDTLPWRSGEAIRQSVETAPAEIAAFVIPVQFVENGSSHGATRVDHVKLFRNGLGVQFERRIHEQILASLRQVGGEIARCPALVLHSGYDTSPDGQKKKRARDSRILELELAERPDEPFTLFNLGMTDHYGGEHAGAVGWLRRCLEVSAPTDSIVRKAYALLALSLRELGEADTALETVEAGLRVTPDDPELHFHRGHLLSARGRYEEAKAAYETVVSCPLDDHFSSVDMGILGYKTFHNLGGICQLLRDYPGAQQWWSRAVADAPQFLPSALALFDSALEVGDFATAERMLHTVQTAAPTGTDAPLLRARLAAAQGNRTGAETALQEAVAVSPDSVQARLALVRCLLADERLLEAETHLHALEQADVAEAAYCLGIMAIRKSDLPAALRWMERAAQLNPDHAETQTQIAHIKQALGTS